MSIKYVSVWLHAEADGEWIEHVQNKVLSKLAQIKNSINVKILKPIFEEIDWVIGLVWLRILALGDLLRTL